MRKVEVTIPGNPIGKGRARSFMRKGGGIGHFTPEKTRSWEGVAKSLAMDAMQRAGYTEPFDGPIYLVITATMPIPENAPKWKRELIDGGWLWPTVKPDSDNIEKALKDALNAVVWRDDVQVVVTTKMKLYGEHPRVHAVIEELQGYTAQQKHKPKE